MKPRQIAFLATIIVFAILNITMNVRADNRFFKSLVVCAVFVLISQMIHDARTRGTGIRTVRTMFMILDFSLAAALGIGFGSARRGIIDESGHLKLDRISITSTAIYLTMILVVAVFVYRSIGKNRFGNRKAR